MRDPTLRPGVGPDSVTEASAEQVGRTEPSHTTHPGSLSATLTPYTTVDDSRPSFPTSAACTGTETPTPRVCDT